VLSQSLTPIRLVWAAMARIRPNRFKSDSRAANLANLLLFFSMK
jgi:hypothetical protein